MKSGVDPYNNAFCIQTGHPLPNKTYNIHDYMICQIIEKKFFDEYIQSKNKRERWSDERKQPYAVTVRALVLIESSIPYSPTNMYYWPNATD